MSLEALKINAISGSIWVLLQNIFNKIVYFLITIVLARILYPADFGTVAAVMIVINFLNVLVDFGVSFSIVQSGDDELKTQSTGFWLTFFLGVSSFIFVLVFASVMADFLSDALLTTYLKIFSFDLVLTGVEIVPIAILNKNMKFRAQILPELLFVATYGVVAVVLSLYNLGAWSIIVAMLLGHFFRTLFYLFLSQIKLRPLFNPKIAKYFFKYGYHAVGASIILWALLNLDKILIKKMIGGEALGYYSLAYTLASLTATHIINIFGVVTLPLYSRLKDDVGILNNSFQKVLRLGSALSLPSATIIIALAPFVVVIYGEKWAPLINLLQILSIFGMFRSVCSICGVMFYAKNKHYILKRIMFLDLVIMVVLAYPFTKFFGMIGTSIAVTISQVITFLIILFYVSKILQTTFLYNLKQITGTFLSAVFAGFFVYILRILSLSVFAGTVQLLLLLLSGIIFYVFILFIINQSVVFEFLKLFQDFKAAKFKNENNQTR